VGLIQNIIEGAGICTISMTVWPWLSASVGVPRAVALRFPQGNMVGEPHKPEQQSAILTNTLRAIETIREPNTILEWPFRWRRAPG
jgi:hypothetical protein